MAYISKIKVPGNNVAYLIKDNEGRLMIAPEYVQGKSYVDGDYYVNEGKLYVVRTTESGPTGIETTVSAELQSIKQSIAGAMHYIGVTDTPLTDGAKKEDFPILNPATPGSLTKTSGFVAGDVVLAPVPKSTGKSEMYYEYVFNGDIWNEFGSTSPIGKMAYANSATGSTTITYKDTKYTGTVDVNEYSGDDESAVKIKTTSVVGSVEAGTTSASSVTKKNKYLDTTKIWTGDSASAVTSIDVVQKGLATTEIFGVSGTGSALTDVTANTMRLKTTSIYGVNANELEASKVERGATNIRVGDTALTTVANGNLGEARDAEGYNPLVGAQVENECLSWFESSIETTQIRGVAYQTVDVPDVKITAVTGIAQKANSATTVATGALVDKTENGGDVVAIGVTGNTDTFAKKGETGTIVATGQLSDNGSDIVTGIDYYGDAFVRASNGVYIDVATGQLSDTKDGANIADAIEVTPVDGLVTGLSVTKNDKVLEKCDSGETGIKVLTNIISTQVTKDVHLTENVKEEKVEVKITVAPQPEPKYLTMTLPEGSTATQISINKQGTPVGTNFQYRVNNGNWTNWDFTSPQPISAVAGDVIQWKGNNTDGLSTSDSNYVYFDITNEVNLSGNVMSLIDGIGNTDVIPCNYCFSNLFKGTKIKMVSEDFLPATTLAEGCYTYMFNGCTSLTTAPELPATTLADSCYGMMFAGSSIATAPALPATTLAIGCYIAMFGGCTSLTTAPELPATTLSASCYGMMFAGSSIATAPALPATTLAIGCYQFMFQGCSNLQNVTCLATDISAQDCTTNWLSGVASTGTFVKAAGFTGWSEGSSGIPVGWTAIEPGQPSGPTGPTGPTGETGSTGPTGETGSVGKYLTMTLPKGSPTTQISINKEGTPVGSNIQYRVNNGEWTNWDFTNPQAISANANDVIQWKGNNPNGISNGSYNYIYFEIPNEVDLSGNVMSLIDGVGDTKVIPRKYCFNNLFLYTNIKTVSKDFLPATTLAEHCYYGMFLGCSSLVNAPELPANTLAGSCYKEMFSGCTSLVNAPELPATTLAGSCYVMMFYRCSSIVTAPELPATTLYGSCYSSMFSGCTSLKNAPALPATTLADSCYNGMFNGCSLTTAPALPATKLAERCYMGMFEDCASLVTAPELPATTLAPYCYYDMFSGCTSLVTAPELPATTLVRNCYRGMFQACSLVNAPALPATTLVDSCYECMFRGCKSLVNAPELPATTFADYCYWSMFAGCSNLKKVTCLATNISGTKCTTNWLSGVASTGTFVKASGFDGWSRDVNGIPEGWNIIDQGQPTGPVGPVGDTSATGDTSSHVGDTTAR